MNKGIVISIDAMMALLVMIVVLTSTVYYLGNVKFDEKNNSLLKENGMDIVTLLEKNGEFEWAVQNNKVNQLRTFMNKLPSSLCLDLSIYSNSNLTEAQLSLLRPSCKKNFSESATINRSFIVENGSNADLYFARLIIWKKVSV